MPVGKAEDDCPPSSSNNNEAGSAGFEHDIGLWPENASEQMAEYWTRRGCGEIANADGPFHGKLQNVTVPGYAPRVYSRGQSTIEKRFPERGCVTLRPLEKFTVSRASY